MTRTKVLVVIKGMGIGGAERLVSEGSRFWDRERFDYKVAYMLPWKDALVPDLEANGIPVECFGTGRGLSIRALTRLRALCRQADVIHSHLPISGTLVRMLGDGCPHVYTEHNLTSSYRPLTRWANRVTYGRNAATTAVSQSVADSLRGYPGPPVRVIPNGVAPVVAPGSAERVRTELALGPEQTLVVHVGNIRQGKGHDTLIEAAVIALAKDPNLTFVSIGSEKVRGDLARLRAIASARGLGDRLRFLGPRSDALDFTVAADIYVNPSEVEGLPVAILEAMAVGRPVVATAAGGVPSVVKTGETGYLVDASDPASLANRVVELAADPAARTEFGERARTLIESRFALKDMVRSYESIYEELSR
jgi:glycosyltransferase involved in cell wall biosynthesis